MENVKDHISPYHLKIANDGKKYIDDNYSKNVSITTISERLNIPRQILMVSFKRAFCISAFHYLHKARMERAKTLLLTTNLPLKKICQETGYSTKNTFLTAFIKTFNLTPTEFRNNGWSNEIIKAECELQYAQIKIAEDKLKELRALCKHENTFEGNYQYRIGNIQLAEICSYCGTAIKFIGI